MIRKHFFKVILVVLLATILLLAFAFLIRQYSLSSTENREVEVVANANVSNQIPANKPNPISNEKVEKDLKLQNQADLLLKLFDNMPSVPVFIKDEPVLKNGTNTERGLAYTTCENKNVPTVFIKKVFYEKNNQKQIVNILKHELTHAYFCRQGFQVGHDELWRKKFESVGGFGN